MKNDFFSAIAQAMGERHSEVLLVYHFGSRAAGRTGPLSDFDLAVYLSGTGPHYDLRALLTHEMCTALGTENVDLIVLNDVPVELAFHAISTGKLLFERTAADRVEYEAYVMSRYGDYLPVLRKQREEILNEGSDQKRIQRYREAIGRNERTPGKAGGRSR